MSAVQLWAWDDTNKKWIPVQVNTSGELIVVAG